MQKYCFAGMNVCNYSRALFRKIYNYLNKEHLKLSISDGNKRKVILEVSFRLDSPLNPNLFILSLSKVLLTQLYHCWSLLSVVMTRYIPEKQSQITIPFFYYGFSFIVDEFVSANIILGGERYD